MDYLPFLLVMASAVSHALWNLLAKDASDKEAFMLLINILSLLVSIPFFVLILPSVSFPVQAAPFLLMSGFAEVVYFVALGKAYELGDLSVVYPLARASPMFIAIVAILVLDEKITPVGFIGILLIVVGVYVLHLKSLGLDEVLEPLRSIRSRASQYALLAALGTTVYSISDKLGVTGTYPLLYSFWLGFVVTGMLTPVVLARKGWASVVNEFNRSKKKTFVSGVLMRSGYVMVLMAMSLAQVSYILAIRQVSVVIGAVLGILVLKEEYGMIRLTGSVIIFLGVFLLGAFT